MKATIRFWLFTVAVLACVVGLVWAVVLARQSSQERVSLWSADSWHAMAQDGDMVVYSTGSADSSPLSRRLAQDDFTLSLLLKLRAASGERWDLSFAGFQYGNNIWGRDWLMIVPLWMPALILGILPLLWIWCVLGPTIRRIRRHRRGLCLRCGYDLRAGGDTCPECGQATGVCPPRPCN